jgi:hypothetical protein
MELSFVAFAKIRHWMQRKLPVLEKITIFLEAPRTHDRSSINVRVSPFFPPKSREATADQWITRACRICSPVT